MVIAVIVKRCDAGGGVLMIENHLCRLASDAQTSQLSFHRVPDSMKSASSLRMLRRHKHAISNLAYKTRLFRFAGKFAAVGLPLFLCTLIPFLQPIADDLIDQIANGTLLLVSHDAQLGQRVICHPHVHTVEPLGVLRVRHTQDRTDRGKTWRQLQRMELNQLGATYRLFAPKCGDMVGVTL